VEKDKVPVTRTVIECGFEGNMKITFELFLLSHGYNSVTVLFSTLTPRLVVLLFYEIL
jgi:hypothetical protein